ncbi:CD1375 family protein [Enterococcus hirae]
MGSIYVELIRKGLKTIEDVPERHKEEVQAILSQTNED